jgi:hypothetical protein
MALRPAATKVDGVQRACRDARDSAAGEASTPPAHESATSVTTTNLGSPLELRIYTPLTTLTARAIAELGATHATH